MGYIEELRSEVGNRPLLLSGVGVGVFNNNGEILLQKNLDGRWGIPGGFMELGESAEETGRREVKEETGLEIGRLKLVTIFSGSETHTILKNGDEYYSVTIIFTTNEILGGDIKADGVETTEADFFAIDRLPEPMSPLIKSLILQYAGQRQK